MNNSRKMRIRALKITSNSTERNPTPIKKYFDNVALNLLKKSCFLYPRHESERTIGNSGNIYKGPKICIDTYDFYFIRNDFLMKQILYG
uniref:Uncharacterized protein n=1 Tax=Ascaris lumbricoides TaxID=6252 RepID=A0A0M3HLN3_ASCLU